MIFLKEMKLIVTHFNTPCLSVQFSSVTRSCLTLQPHGLQHVRLLVMPSNHLILCRPLLLPPSIFPSFRVFSNESVLPIRWPKYWSFRNTHWKDWCWSWNAKVWEVLLMEYYIFIFTVSSVTNFKQWCEHYFL